MAYIQTGLSSHWDAWPGEKEDTVLDSVFAHPEQPVLKSSLQPWYAGEGWIVHAMRGV